MGEYFGQASSLTKIFIPEGKISLSHMDTHESKSFHKKFKSIILK